MKLTVLQRSILETVKRITYAGDLLPTKIAGHRGFAALVKSFPLDRVPKSLVVGLLVSADLEAPAIGNELRRLCQRGFLRAAKGPIPLPVVPVEWTRPDKFRVRIDSADCSRVTVFSPTGTEYPHLCVDPPVYSLTPAGLELLDAPLKTLPGKSTPPESMGGEERALAVLTAHPEWTNTKIAKTVGVHRTTLNRYRRFMGAREFMKGRKPADRRKGRTGKPIRNTNCDYECDTPDEETL